MEIEHLQAELRSAKSGVAFLQNEHALMLKGLHEEVEKLQQRCTDLQSQLSIRAVDGLEVELLQDKNVKLERLIEEQRKELEDKTKLIEELKEQYQWREVQLQNEVKSQQLQIDRLKNDLLYYERRTVNRSLDGDTSSIRSLSSTSLESIEDFNERKLPPRMIEINSMNPSRGPPSRAHCSRKPKLGSFSREQHVSLSRQHSDGHVPPNSNKSSPLFLALMKSSSHSLPHVTRVKSSSSDSLPPDYRASVSTLPPIHTLPRSYDRHQRPLVRQQLRVQSAMERSNALSIDQVVPTSRRYELQTEQNDSEF